MKKSRVLIVVIMPSLAFSMGAPVQDARARIARAAKAEMARQKQEQDAREKATKERAAQAHGAHIKKAHADVIAKHVGAAKRKAEQERLAQERRDRLAPALSQVSELKKKFEAVLKEIQRPSYEFSTDSDSMENLLSYAMQLYQQPREIFSIQARKALAQQLSSLNYRQLPEEIQKSLNSLMRRLGGAPKKVVPLEQKGERITRIQREFFDALNLMPHLATNDVGYAAHIQGIADKANILLQSDSAFVNEARIIKGLEEFDYAKLPEHSQKMFNELLKKFGATAKDIIPASQQKQVLEERRKTGEDRQRKEKEALEAQEAEYYATPLKDGQGEDFQGKKTVLDVRHVEDVIAQEPLKDLIDAKQKDNKRFVLARVISEDKGKEYVHYYAEENISEWMNKQATDPNTRAQIKNIQYFLYVPSKRVFNYLGDTAIKNYVGDGEQFKKRQFLEEMIKAARG